MTSALTTTLLLAAVSAALVYAIRRLTGSSQLMETAIKVPVDVALFLASYQIQKRWVFRAE